MAFLSKSVSFQKSRALIYIPCINYNLMDDCILGGWLAIPWDPRVDWRSPRFLRKTPGISADVQGGMPSFLIEWPISDAILCPRFKLSAGFVVFFESISKYGPSCPETSKFTLH
jgi:hypothetical protein